MQVNEETEYTVITVGEKSPMTQFALQHTLFAINRAAIFAVHRQLRVDKNYVESINASCTFST